MEIVKKPDIRVFASGAKTGEILSFPDVLRGWGITLDQTQGKPPIEWMNDAFNRIDLNNLYLLQQGIPEWNKSTRYPINAIIKHADKIYLCTAENENNEPSANSDKWSLYIRNASEKDAGILKLATQAEVNTGTNDISAVTPKKLAEKLKKLPEASLTQKGIVQLTSTIDDSEDKAATPKAVNTAQKTANEAKTAAETADTKAVNAQTSANAASTAAKNADTKADAAQATADAAQTAANAKAASTINIIAGNGLSGGGTLAANRTITLGTPTKITATSTNSVATASHTHEIDKASLTVAGVTQLTSTLSDSETVAATIKSVNNVNRAANTAQTTANNADAKAVAAQTKANQVPNPVANNFVVGNTATAYKLMTVAQVKTLLGVPAAAKLYSGTGQATDGAMTQKAVTDTAFGIGQSYQDVTAQRLKDTIYTNNTKKTIEVRIEMIMTQHQSGSRTLRAWVGSTRVLNEIFTQGQVDSSTRLTYSFLVPPGSTYNAIPIGGDFLQWMEFR